MPIGTYYEHYTQAHVAHHGSEVDANVSDFRAPLCRATEFSLPAKPPNQPPLPTSNAPCSLVGHCEDGGSPVCACSCAAQEERAPGSLALAGSRRAESLVSALALQKTGMRADTSSSLDAPHSPPGASGARIGRVGLASGLQRSGLSWSGTADANENDWPWRVGEKVSAPSHPRSESPR